jgi:hypothetical protein
MFLRSPKARFRSIPEANRSSWLEGLRSQEAESDIVGINTVGAETGVHDLSSRMCGGRESGFGYPIQFTTAGGRRLNSGWSWIKPWTIEKSLRRRSASAVVGL